jgi:DNA (cytosine-5)-methyltransferase 1
MSRPRLLDLFCGAGGAAMGYSRAGFDVVGVDIKPQPHYPFEFHQADAMAYPLDGFDVIHASPPCQAYSTNGNKHRNRGSGAAGRHPALIGATRARLAGRRYVIENVAGAAAELREPTRLTGEMFGLRTHRARLFETNWLLLSPSQPPRQASPVAVYGKLDGRRLWTRKDGSEHRAPRELATAADAMGIDWMSWDELREAIPPAYTEWIGLQLLVALRAVR